MKKATMETVISLISNIDSAEAEQVRLEINTELAKSKAKADTNRAIYAGLHDKVMEVLENTSSPVTAQEIAEELGVSRGKIVHGLTHYWTDEVVKDKSGKTTTYAKA